MRTTFVLTQAQHLKLMAHLFPGDGLEAAAIGIGVVTKTANRERLLLHKVFLLPHEKCVRKPDRLSWDTSLIVDILNEADRLGLSIIKMHSHPGFYDKFSLLDDDADKSLFPSIYEWGDSKVKHYSAIFLPDGKINFRLVKRDGSFSDGNCVSIVGEQIRMLELAKESVTFNQADQKIMQVFGEKTHSLMRSLRIAVIGCSGTGSCVVEALKRHMVGEIVLIDPDRVEVKNLNRILGATLEDALKNRLKVEVLKREIEKAGLGTKVTCHPSYLSNEDVIRDLSTCDIVFGCMDTISGRHLLNLICTYFSIPYFDVGVSIHADGKGGIYQACAAVNYIQPGLSSLMSRGIYSSEDLRSETLMLENPEMYLAQKKEGYVKGIAVERPAVYNLNSLAAGFAMGDFLARVHGYRFESGSSQEMFSLVHNEYFVRAEEDFEIYKPWSENIGLGEKFFIKEQYRLKRAVSSIELKM